VAGERHPTLEVLALPDMRAFVLARLFGATAHSLLHAALSWHVFDAARALYGARSAYAYLGLLGVAQFAPVIPVALVGGVVADSRDRRDVVGAARAASLVCAGALALAAAHGAHDPRWILALAFALAVAWGFEFPAGQALLPALVPRGIFPNAVVVGATARNVATVAGPMLAGFAIAAAGVGSAYAAGAALYALSLAALLGVRRPGVSGDGSGVSLGAVREGIAFVGRRPAVLGSMTLDMFAVVFASVTALLPVYAEEILGVGPRGYGVLSASISVGTFLMTLLLLFRRELARPGRALLASVLFFGLATVVFGLSRSFPLSIAALVATGLADQVSVVARSTIVQLSTPDALRGRVSAVNMVFIGASNELGAAESGFLAAATSATFSVVFGGLACLGVLGLVTARVPALRHYRVDAAESS
jgi:MFS family permease